MHDSLPVLTEMTQQCLVDAQIDRRLYPAKRYQSALAAYTLAVTSDVGLALPTAEGEAAALAAYHSEWAIRVNGKGTSAEEWIDRSLSALPSDDSRARRATVHTDIIAARIYARRGDKPTAFAWLDEAESSALELQKDTDVPEASLSVISFFRGVLHLAEGRAKQAHEAASAGRAKAREVATHSATHPPAYLSDYLQKNNDLYIATLLTANQLKGWERVRRMQLVERLRQTL